MGPTSLPSSLLGLGLAEVGLAVLVAVVLLELHRSYGRSYLRDWGWSWLALAAFSAGSLGAFFLSPRPGVGRLALMLLSQLGGYWHIGLFAFGAQDVASGTPVSARRRLGVLVALAVAAAATAVVRTVGSVQGRMLLGVGVMSFANGVVFVACGVAIWRSRVWRVAVGRRLVGGAIIGSGLGSLRLTLETLGSRPFQGVLQMAHSPVLTGVVAALSILVAVAVATGVLVGLLAEERARAQRASDELHHLAFFDPLTRVPNRRLFTDHVRLGLAQAERRRGVIAVLAVNLDRFTALNNALGRAGGDEVLRVVAERLTRGVRRGDTVGRLGGDVFGVLLDDLENAASAPAHAQRLLEELRKPLRLHTTEVVTTASIGVCTDGGAGDAETLLRNAEQAAWHARRSGRNQWAAYQLELDEHSQERVAFERLVREAVVTGALEVHYQVIADVHDRTGVMRVEALVRLVDGDRLLMPTEFVPVAERLGIGDELDFWVMRVAAAQTQAWRASVAPNLSVAVNLGARTFYHHELLERLAKILADTGLPARALHLEITETVAMENTAVTLDVLQGLRRFGVGLAIDDFGTGHSSLAYLRNYPIDELKLDRSFVRDLATAPDAAAISAAVIALSHSLHVAVVAEGVETEAQWGLLEQQGCDQIQGFLIGRPEPADVCGRRLGAVPARGQETA